MTEHPNAHVQYALLTAQTKFWATCQLSTVLDRDQG